ncbi:MAG: DUF6311 domain-containing protein [Rhodoferax sp.]
MAASLAGAGLLAAALFVWVFGTDVLDVRQAGWMIHGDSAQHYLGWAFLRTSAWQWPLGTVASFGYPFTTTVAFTDSIPLVALPAKLLSPCLPDVFNYFGWWMAACLVGNAVAAAWVLRRLGLSQVAVLAGAGMFALTPCMMLRAYGHESLMAQGLLVVALGLALRPSGAQVFRPGPWCWLLVVCVLVHPYFWVMVSALFVGALGQAWWQQRALPWPRALLWLLLGGGCSALALLGLGYFDVGGKTLAAVGYPNYSANLLTWVDPTDWHWFLRQYQRPTEGAAQWSRFLPFWGQAHQDQYEGFAYWGLGMLLVFAVALGALWWRPVARGAGVAGRPGPCAPHVWGWPVWAVLGLLAVYALSTRVTLGPWVLLDLPRSEAVHRLLSVFRACGRFVWPLTYALMLWALAQLLRLGARAQGGWVLLALGLQVADLSDKMGEFHRMYAPAKAYASPLTDPRWAGVMQAATHLILLEDASQSDDGVAFSFLAARHRVVNSAGMISRVNEQQLAAWLQAQRQRVLAGQAEPGHVYVSRSELPLPVGWVQLHLNGWWVLAAAAH